MSRFQLIKELSGCPIGAVLATELTPEDLNDMTQGELYTLREAYRTALETQWLALRLANLIHERRNRAEKSFENLSKLP